MKKLIFTTFLFSSLLVFAETKGVSGCNTYATDRLLMYTNTNEYHTSNSGETNSCDVNLMYTILSCGSFMEEQSFQETMTPMSIFEEGSLTIEFFEGETLFFEYSYNKSGGSVQYDSCDQVMKFFDEYGNIMHTSNSDNLHYSITSSGTVQFNSCLIGTVAVAQLSCE